MTAWRSLLTEACAGRDLSDAAVAERDRLLLHGSEAEIELVLTHLRHLPPIDPERINVCPETMAALEIEWSAHQARCEAHRNRLGATAYRLGCRVGSHDLALPDAQRQIDWVAALPDPEWSIPDPMLSTAEADTIVEDAYRRGLRTARAA